MRSSISHLFDEVDDNIDSLLEEVAAAYESDEAFDRVLGVLSRDSELFTMPRLKGIRTA